MEDKMKGIKLVGIWLILLIMNISCTTSCDPPPPGPTAPIQEYGSVAISSIPSDAYIYLDGKNMLVKTPDTLSSVSIGSHEVKLTMFNYLDWIDTVNVTKNATTTVTATLIPKTGTIIINSNPKGAAIWLDGNNTGNLTPDTLINTPVGWHSIKLTLYNYYDYNTSVNLVEGQAAAVDAKLNPKCPGEIIGNLSLPPEIKIIGLNPGDYTVHGIANNIDASKIRVVIWVLTNNWYVQPYVASPYTTICGDGSWSSYTHTWKRIVVLLVDSTYVPGSVRYDHPAFEKGVLAWDQYPAPRPDLPLQFSGYQWGIKVSEDPFDPGPNYWSDSPDNIWVDGQGLHLKIIYQNGHWTTSELYLLQSLGYGEYIIQLASRVDSLDSRVVFSPFVYEKPGREIDIEFSRALVPSPNNAQYVIQPYTNSGNIVYFFMPSVKYSTHRFIWQSSSVEFMSWKGLEETPSPDSIIYSWTYTGADIPPPGGERMRFNLWLFGGNPPLSGIGDEVIVKSFKHKQ